MESPSQSTTLLMTHHCLRINEKLISNPYRPFTICTLQASHLPSHYKSHSLNTPNNCNHSFWSFLNEQCSSSPLAVVHMCYSLCLEFVLSLPQLVPWDSDQILPPTTPCLEFCIPPECSIAPFFYACHDIPIACLMFASPPRLGHPRAKEYDVFICFFFHSYTQLRALFTVVNKAPVLKKLKDFTRLVFPACSREHCT